MSSQPKIIAKAIPKFCLSSTKRFGAVAFFISIFKFLYVSLYPLFPLWPKISFHNINQLSLITNQSKGSWLNQKHKTNPKRTQTNPIFQGSIFDLSKKIRIFDKFRQHFLCKTNPIICLLPEYETPENTKNDKQSHFAPVQHQKIWCWENQPNERNQSINKRLQQSGYLVSPKNKAISNPICFENLSSARLIEN